jgi:hypothetical protein
MGIKQNYLYRVLPGLADDGLVVKDGRGWKPTELADEVGMLGLDAPGSEDVGREDDRLGRAPTTAVAG